MKFRNSHLGSSETASNNICHFLGSRISWALWPHKSAVAMSLFSYTCWQLLSFPKAELAALSPLTTVTLPPGSAPFPQENQPHGKGLAAARESSNLSVPLGKRRFLFSVNLMMVKRGVKSGAGPSPVVSSCPQPPLPTPLQASVSLWPVFCKG